jgi:adenylylsulfate kinase
VSRLFADAGIVVLSSFITPLREQRTYIREQFNGMKYLEVFIKCSVEECICRDPKGLYRKAIEGKIGNYTGISSPFEEPENPDLVLDTGHMDIEESVNRVLSHLRERDFLSL